MGRDRAGDVRQRGHVVGEHRPVVVDERRDLVERDRQVLQGEREVVAFAGELVGDARQPAVQLAHLVIAAGQRGRERLQVADGAEQVVATARQRTDRLGQLGDRLVDVVPLAIEVACRRAEDARQRPVLPPLDPAPPPLPSPLK